MIFQNDDQRPEHDVMMIYEFIYELKDHIMIFEHDDQDPYAFPWLLGMMIRSL